MVTGCTDNNKTSQVEVRPPASRVTAAEAGCPPAVHAVLHSDRPCGWDLAQVPMWAAGDFFRILRETLAPGEELLQIAAYPPDESDAVAPTYRFDVSYQWWHSPGDGPYVDNFSIIVHRSRCCQHTVSSSLS